MLLKVYIVDTIISINVCDKMRQKYRKLNNPACSYSKPIRPGKYRFNMSRSFFDNGADPIARDAQWEVYQRSSTRFCK